MLLAFLQRRRHEAAKVLPLIFYKLFNFSSTHSDVCLLGYCLHVQMFEVLIANVFLKAKELSLTVMRSMILERRPLTVIGTAMDVLTSSYAQGARPPNGTGGSSFQPTQFTKPLASTIAGITLSAGPRAGGPSSLTATPGVQSAVVMSSSGAASLRLPQDTEDSGDSEDDQVQASAPLRPEQGLATEDVLECTSDQGITGSPEIEEESPTSVSHDLSSESSGRLVS